MVGRPSKPATAARGHGAGLAYGAAQVPRSDAAQRQARRRRGAAGLEGAPGPAKPTKRFRAHPKGGLVRTPKERGKQRE
jgi:hypothetical protein